MTTKPSVRAQRKAETRASLIRSARELFSRLGYDNTTLEAVASHADLHVQTLYRHFSSKEHLATASESDYLERFRGAITGPERQGTTFEFWRGWLTQGVGIAMRDGGTNYRAYLRSQWEHPKVSGRLIAIHQEMEDLLTQSVASDFAKPNPTLARLVAIALFHGQNHVIRQFYCADDGFDFLAESIAVVDQVAEQFGYLLPKPASEARATATIPLS